LQHKNASYESIEYDEDDLQMGVAAGMSMQKPE
jgi:hypothetical protein